MKLFKVCLVILNLWGAALGAKILAMFPISSYSHQIVYRSLMLELNRRGHEITIITTDPINNSSLTGYREIDGSFAYDLWRSEFDFASDSARLLRIVPELLTLSFIPLMDLYCNRYLSEPAIKQLIDSKEQFDLLFLESEASYCYYPFAKQSNDIIISMMSLNLPVDKHFRIGSPASPAYLPDTFLPFVGHLSFYERLRSTIFLSVALFYNFVVLRKCNDIARKHFGDDIPAIEEIERNVSIYLINTHHSTSRARPLPANVIEFGGPPFHLHGVEPRPLPTDLQEYLDSAEHGVIYLSLGSNVKSSTMPERKLKLFLDAFGQFKEKILWKWETDKLPGQPANVKLGKWMPQVEILAHPNLKVFMTQGGLQSISEAMHFAVPMVVIPFFADQEFNAAVVESKGLGVKLNFETLTADSIVDALKKVLNDPSYITQTRLQSELSKDQPLPPMEKAVWWTEYVLRYNGARHLRSAALDLTWYQYLLLDVVAVLGLAVAFVMYTTCVLIKQMKRLLKL